MFNNSDLYPTPEATIKKMLQGINIKNKIVLEPSAANGNIIDYLNKKGAKNVLFCEIEKDLAEISKKKATFLTGDFLNVKKTDVSHIDLIVMNPPFSKDLEHILHALEIAPDGCEIISLCNAQTIENPYSKKRKELLKLVEIIGNYENYGNCFSDAERKTNIEIGYLYFKKPEDQYQTEFFGFIDEEDENKQDNGIMQYNAIRDLVGRYIMAVKKFDQQEALNKESREITNGFFSNSIGFSAKDERGNEISRESYKKELQKSGWQFIFNKMNLQKFTTSGVKEDINKQIEQSKENAFTMKNIYHVIDMIVQTSGQRMEKALLEVFDKLTKHYSDNRYNVEGWKTNSHYMLNQKFILGYLVEPLYHNKNLIDPKIGGNFDKIEDFLKALCFLTGDNFEDFKTLYNTLNTHHFAYIGEGDNKKIVKSSRNEIKEYEITSLKHQYPNEKITITYEPKEFGKWLEWAYFDIKCFKKGTIHFKFKDRELWGRFNQRIAKIKGYPLFESNEQTRKKQAKKQAKESKKTEEVKKAKVLFTYNI